MSDPPALRGVTHRYVDAGGLRVHVAEAGDPDAPPVLLQHGWPQCWWAWRKVIPALAEHHRVIAPDLRGHGWTDAPRGGYDKEQLATDMLATLDALDIERVCLLGHDWGAWSGFLACFRAPERFARFMVVNMSHPWAKPNPRALLDLWRLTYMAVVGTPVLGPAALRHAGPLLRRAFRNDGPNPGDFTDEDVRIYVDRWREPDRARASSELYRTFLLREVGPIARGRYDDRRLTVPGLLLFGRDDPVIRPYQLDDLGEHADDFPVEIVDGCGHFIAEERPQLVAERALALFAGA